jgi:O-acetyl-ADP-ribose deacetylase (regulator of RNase III)
MNTVLAERVLPTGQTIQIVQGDITAETTDAIVNAANEHLQHSAGVAGAILRRGGQVIQQESDAWVRKHGKVSHSQPAWTSGGLLPAKYVIHAVGPVWGESHKEGTGSDEKVKLAAAIRGSLEVADELKLTSISFPAISTGIFGFPKELAADVIFTSIEKYFSKSGSGLKLVRLVLFDEATIRAFIKRWESVK